MARQAILVFLLAPLASSCSSPPAPGMPDLAALGPQPDLLPDPRAVHSTLSADEADKARASCTFKAGTLPGLSLAKDAPIGGELPIDTIVLIMMENRSFDHLLSDLPAAGQPDVEVAPPSAQNLDPKGTPVKRFKISQFCFNDPEHGWESVHRQYNNGKMDGFVTENAGIASDPLGHRAMAFHDRHDLPLLYSLATTYAVADHYYCGLLGPTFPNREYLYAATSFGRIDNALFNDKRNILVSELDAAGVPWHEYFESLPGEAVFTQTIGDRVDRFVIDDPQNGFFAAAAAGELANVVFVDPNLLDDDSAHHDDFHPPASAQFGDTFLKKVLTPLMASPQWPHMAIFITWDEHGGLYDHVAPPPACPPDDHKPTDSSGNVLPGAFDRYGMRVPLIVVSPYAKPHSVAHRTYSHSSLTRFVEARFLLPALSGRDANSEPPYEMFDFTQAPLLHPPALPDAPLDPAQEALCKQLYPFPPNSPDAGAPDAK